MTELIVGFLAGVPWGIVLMLVWSSCLGPDLCDHHRCEKCQEKRGGAD